MWGRIANGLRVESVAEAAKEGGQAGTVLVGERDELETEAVAGPDVADHGFRSDLALVDQEVDFGGYADCAMGFCFEEQSAEAEVADSGDVFAPVAIPADPYIALGNQAGVESPRGRACNGIHRSTFQGFRILNEIAGTLQRDDTDAKLLLLADR
jgi:hypothetical protein